MRARVCDYRGLLVCHVMVGDTRSEVVTGCVEDKGSIDGIAFALARRRLAS